MQVLSWIASHSAFPKVHVCLPYRSLNCMQMGVLQIFATLKCFSSSILYLSESSLNALVSAKTLLPNRSIRGVLTSVLHCAVLCCAVLSCAVLCRAVLIGAVLCCAVRESSERDLGNRAETLPVPGVVNALLPGSSGILG